MSDQDTILAAIQIIQKTNDESHKDIKLLIDNNHRMITAELGAMEDRMNVRFNNICDRQDIANGKLMKHESRLGVLEKDIIGGWTRRHLKLVAVITCISLYLLYYVFEHFSLTDLVKLFN